MDFQTAKTIGLVLLGVLLVGGVLLSLLVRAVVGKVLVLVVAVAAAGFVFSQRVALSDAVCAAQPSFLGVSVDVSPDLRAQCSTRLTR
ncbi:hypothetical protein RHODO2019_00490 [Rhodococcus antarcticus]|uniref:Uncharacterized protein n=1 Tax=Rhodococcus antarcticus TaxID=2987751 RepID=A0ABY6P038_9NOCA|nr:hypothetical protein [Rhodococcus antarcticus]UZJ25029.1 hypothetical protein RHODO2019_00490 [Rhodococcus antarcticus]